MVEKALRPEIAAKRLGSRESAFTKSSYRLPDLAVSLVFILFLALLIYLKVRQIE